MALEARMLGHASHPGQKDMRACVALGDSHPGHHSIPKPQDYIGRLMECPWEDLHGQLKSIDSIDCYTYL
jgi:hypothetical protein